MESGKAKWCVQVDENPKFLMDVIISYTTYEHLNGDCFSAEKFANTYLATQGIVINLQNDKERQKHGPKDR